MATQGGADRGALVHRPEHCWLLLYIALIVHTTFLPRRTSNLDTAFVLSANFYCVVSLPMAVRGRKLMLRGNPAMMPNPRTM
jgi:hypothetical protein